MIFNEYHVKAGMLFADLRMCNKTYMLQSTLKIIRGSILAILTENNILPFYGNH
jgi:hypothetical protein